jgi:hypothetical protein
VNAVFDGGSPRPGVYSGPAAVATAHPWLWVALTALVLLAVGTVTLLLRAGGATPRPSRRRATTAAPADPHRQGLLNCRVPAADSHRPVRR